MLKVKKSYLITTWRKQNDLFSATLQIFWSEIETSIWTRDKCHFAWVSHSPHTNKPRNQSFYVSTKIICSYITHFVNVFKDDFHSQQQWLPTWKLFRCLHMLYSFTNILLYFVYISHMFLQFEYIMLYLVTLWQIKKWKENSPSVVFLYTVFIQFFRNCIPWFCCAKKCLVSHASYTTITVRSCVHNYRARLYKIV